MVFTAQIAPIGAESSYRKTRWMTVVIGFVISAQSEASSEKGLSLIPSAKQSWLTTV